MTGIDWGTVAIRLNCGCRLVGSGAVDWAPGDRLECGAHGPATIAKCDADPTYADGYRRTDTVLELGVAMCEDHGNLVNHETRKVALSHAPHPDNWCEECRQDR